MEKHTEKDKKDLRVRVGITHGDINGISYEIIIKTLMEPKIVDFCLPIVYGSSKVFSYHRKLLNINDFSLNLIKKADQANPKRPNIINCTEEEALIELGKSTPTAGKLAILAIEQAINDAKQGQIDVIVTAPINKKSIQSDSFNFPGHTEFLAQKYNASEYLMMMVSDTMRIGFATGHVPLSKVSENLTEEIIIKKLRIMNRSLLQDFAIRKPKIAVLSLNPHAGDDGVLGHEENNIIIPAIRNAFKEGIMAIGPIPADGFFGMGKFNDYDAILAMYHDQGMVPFKGFSFDSGVNFTAGLPIVRTSPAHGTAFEIAGKDEASPDSFRNAIYVACDIFKNRQMWEEINSNPLKISSLSSDKTA